MSVFNDMRARHLKMYLSLGFFCNYIFMNWGHTLGGIKHVFLLVVTRDRKTLEGDVLEEIDKTIIDFGETAALLSVHIFVFYLIMKIIDWFDFDSPFQEFDIKSLQRDKRKLLQEVQELSEVIERHLIFLRHLDANRNGLAKHIDQLGELGFAMDKLNRKSIKSPDMPKKTDKEQAPDLFNIAKPKSKSPPRRKASNKPNL